MAGSGGEAADAVLEFARAVFQQESTGAGMKSLEGVCVGVVEGQDPDVLVA